MGIPGERVGRSHPPTPPPRPPGYAPVTYPSLVVVSLGLLVNLFRFYIKNKSNGLLVFDYVKR